MEPVDVGAESCYNANMNSETYPLAVLQLSGSQEEMGRQFGEIMNQIGQFEPIFDFYPVMARNLLLGSLPRKNRNALARGATSLLVNWMVNRMKKNRPSEFSARTRAALSTAGRSIKIEKDLFTMDAFQNSVGLLGMIQVLPELAHISPSRTPQMVPACTSVAVWGDQSQDGKLYHARNFDFPGVEVWDKRPIVVFCTPKKGLRYGYIACRGADVPGITAFNEAGLTIAFHTRFHKKVGFSGLGVIDFGHKIISEAKNIQEAVEIAKKNKINSTWGAILTNHKEKGPKAAILETNYGNVDVVYPRLGADHIVNTNHYQSEKLQEGELMAAPVFYHHCITRFDRAEELLTSQRKRGTSVVDLQDILDDTIDPSSGEARTMGSTIRQITSVKSVVMSVEARKIFVSLGTAPTGSGPYVEVPMAWGEPGYQILGLDGSTEKKSKSKASSSQKKTKSIKISENKKDLSVQYYKKAMLINDDPSLGGVEEILSELEKASQISQEDPSLLFMQAVLHLETGRFKEAAFLLEQAENLEPSSFRKQQSQLWLARTQSVLGRQRLADHFYNKILDAKPEFSTAVWKKKVSDDKGSYSAKKLRQTSPNFLIVDANEL
ncbi:acyl-CoA--6-aminopenicillanic acid acyltransferase [Leptospira langatensis]|uniref:Acyl-CoA--6-aminopenicillanic acid acyltransferase n=1 Tax=Leptospira langatensis TaxID=2484983 RepID=A0A5F1ZNT9_9LEPT|nr:C45 family autoproteolytic acyltransferase/hydolase [Leptospira langatensis]TGK05175.1 acyl-CoA--6-aminopenicillanic acid acyltransferase [Leptospira langatensis]TGL38311.1 acyl-CoA--6-aminopenicillanic acid acyltransferase [Leptospira langatensis]